MKQFTGRVKRGEDPGCVLRQRSEPVGQDDPPRLGRGSVCWRGVPGARAVSRLLHGPRQVRRLDDDARLGQQPRVRRRGLARRERRGPHLHPGGRQSAGIHGHEERYH